MTTVTTTRPTVPTDASDLLSAMAHEMRTPLASVSATIEQLRGDFDTLSRDQASAMIFRIQRGTLWLQRLVEDTFLSAALDKQQVSLRRERVVVGECVDEVREILLPLLEDRAQRLDVVGDCGMAVEADRTRLGQIVLNLVVNASKYSCPGDVLRVELAARDGRAEIRVVDHGPGISAADQPDIFEPHTRGSASAGTVGLGLGLHIVRRLVELHHGTIDLESAPGLTAFTISLPTWRTA